MRFLSTIRDMLTPPQMAPADLAAWQSARTFDDLGDLTARWLEGDLKSVPGVYPGCGPDPETTALIPTLAACNRTGFVTSQSQPGESGPGYDGAFWEQRAAVTGWVTDQHTLNRLGAVVEHTELQIRLPRTRNDAIAVTRRRGQSPITRFGRLNERWIRDNWEGYGLCHPDAVRALVDAHQVVIWDPRWGRNDLLWAALDEFAASARYI